MASFVATKTEQLAKSAYLPAVVGVLNEAFEKVVEPEMSRRVLAAYQALACCEGIPAGVETLIPTAIVLALRKVAGESGLVKSVAEMINAVLTRREEMLRKVLCDNSAGLQTRKGFVEQLWQRKGNIRKIAEWVKELCSSQIAK